MIFIMPRQARIDAPGAFHHIICRGMERQAIFRDDVDRDDLVSRLSKILPESSTRCFAWALIPNHFHLLLQTGKAPIAQVMRRLLTGYSVKFNHRHRRHGHLFQNRYKSILCQEDPYLLELVRYIHLNPFRAGVVSTLEDLADFPYCGHGCLLGSQIHNWQTTGEILDRFGKRAAIAREKYLNFVVAGIAQGRRPDLVGGGLVRSAGGWQQLASLRQERSHLKSDERILGDSEFVESVLQNAKEWRTSRDPCRNRKIDFKDLGKIVAEKLGVNSEDIWRGGKQPKHVAARSLLCFWAVKELGRTATEVASQLGVSQSAVSRSVQRGEKLAKKTGWNLEEATNA